MCRTIYVIFQNTLTFKVFIGYIVLLFLVKTMDFSIKKVFGNYGEIGCYNFANILK